jgi:hypothetical protein
LPRDSGRVSVFSQFPRALVSAAEHVGKQNDGVSGWRPTAGSAGIAGGGVLTNEGGDTLPQLLRNSASGTSILPRRFSFMSGRIGYLRLCRGAALFLEASLVDRLDLGARLIQRQARALRFVARIIGARLLPAPAAVRQSQGDG